MSLFGSPAVLYNSSVQRATTSVAGELNGRHFAPCFEHSAPTPCHTSTRPSHTNHEIAMTTLTRRQPTHRHLQKEVDRLFDSFFTPSWAEDGDEPTPSAWSPRMDLTETDNAYRLMLDLPGLEKQDITLRVENNRLFVSGERHEETRAEDQTLVHMERSFGAFYRSIRLPREVQEDKIKARFENGVLKIDLPKAESSMPKKIEIT